MNGMHLSARRKTELCMVAAMLYRVAATAFRSDAALRDGGAMPAANAACLDDLRTAALEPIELELDPDRRRKLVRRAERASLAALEPYEDRPIATVFAVLLYWLDEELRTGRLELVEGSPAARAIQALIDMLVEEHADTMAAVERSAKKQVPKFRRHLVRLGYFHESPEARDE